MINIYTDGASKGNPGPSGIGIVFLINNQSREYGEFLGHGTNNIAELTAVLRALQLINDKNNDIVIHTDSEYVIGTFQGGYTARKNQELIQKIKNEIRKFNSVKFVKVKAHADDYYNNIADQLAVNSIENNMFEEELDEILKKTNWRNQ